MRSFSGSQSMWKISAVGEGRVLCGILEGAGRWIRLATHRYGYAPWHVTIQDQDEVCLLDEGILRLSKRYSRVCKVVEGDVDGRYAGAEDGYCDEVDELDQLVDSGLVPTEVRGDDEGFLRTEQGFRYDGDGCSPDSTGFIVGGGAGTYWTC